MPSNPRKGAPADRRGQQDQLRFEPQRLLADRAVHDGADRAQLRGADLFRDLQPRAERIVHLRRAEQVERHFLAAGVVNLEHRRAVVFLAGLVEAQRLAVGAELFEEIFRAPPRVLDDADFRHHHRPAENRADEQAKQDQLAGQRGFAERKEQRIDGQGTGGQPARRRRHGPPR